MNSTNRLLLKKKKYTQNYLDSLKVLTKNVAFFMQIKELSSIFQPSLKLLFPRCEMSGTDSEQERKLSSHTVIIDSRSPYMST